jgi:hypothetical protein
LKIPLPEELHEPLRAAKEKDAQISVSLAPLTARATELRAKERENLYAHSNNSDEENRIRLLTGQPPLAKATEKSELEDVLIAIQDRKNARERLDAIIQKEKAIASRLVCQNVRSEVTRLGKIFAGAFLELHTAHKDYHRFIDAVEDTGASTSSLGRVWPNGLGHFADCSGTYHYGFKEFLEAGLIEKASIPVEVR